MISCWFFRLIKDLSVLDLVKEFSVCIVPRSVEIDLVTFAPEETSYKTHGRWGDSFSVRKRLVHCVSNRVNVYRGGSSLSVSSCVTLRSSKVDPHRWQSWGICCHCGSSDKPPLLVFSLQTYRVVIIRCNKYYREFSRFRVDQIIF